MFITLTFLPSASGLNLSTGSPRHEEITRLPSNTSHLNEFMIGFDTVTVTIYKCLIMYYSLYCTVGVQTETRSCFQKRETRCYLTEQSTYKALGV